MSGKFFLLLSDRLDSVDPLGLLLIGRRQAVDLSRCAGPYMALFLVTHILRPACTDILRYTSLYDYLRIDPFYKHWGLMATVSRGFGVRLLPRPISPPQA